MASLAFFAAGCNDKTDDPSSTPTTPTTSAPTSTEAATAAPGGNTGEPAPSSSKPVALAIDFASGVREAWVIDAWRVVDVNETYLLVEDESNVVSAYDITGEEPELLWKKMDDPNAKIRYLFWGNLAVTNRAQAFDLHSGEPVPVDWSDDDWGSNPDLAVSGDTLVVCEAVGCSGFAPDGTTRWSDPDLTWTQLRVNGEGAVAGLVSMANAPSLPSAVILPSGETVLFADGIRDALAKDGCGVAEDDLLAAANLGGLRPLSDGWLVTVAFDADKLEGEPPAEGRVYHVLFSSDGTLVNSFGFDGNDALLPNVAISSTSTLLPSVKDWENQFQNPDPWLVCDGATCTINANPIEDFTAVNSATALGEGGTLLLHRNPGQYAPGRIAVVTAEGDTSWDLELSGESIYAPRPDLIIAAGVNGTRTITGVAP
ncbi:MAG: hypothetical protein QM705_12860 [Ancrocorticia sp.]